MATQCGYDACNITTRHTIVLVCVCGGERCKKRGDHVKPNEYFEPKY